MNPSLVYAAYGGGVDSTAMLIEMWKRGMKVDLIGFADPGSERARTYEYRKMFSAWLVERGFPEMFVVRAPNTTLYADCMKRKALPAIAYGGFKTCSQRFKIEPQDKALRNLQAVKDVWAAGGKVLKLIGYDTDEEHRAKPYSDDKFVVGYPLIDFDMSRDDCEKTILDAGLALPGKSACTFCPNSTPEEIIQLGEEYPDALEEALALEANAQLTNIAGLGRSWSWADVVKADRAQIKLFASPPQIACGGACGL